MSNHQRKRKAIQQFPSRKQKKPIAKEGIRWKIHSVLLIAFIILLLVHNQFIKQETIGHDIRYDLYIVGMPVLVGVIALIVYQWNFIKELYLEIRGVKDFLFFLLRPHSSSLYLLHHHWQHGKYYMGIPQHKRSRNRCPK